MRMKVFISTVLLVLAAQLYAQEVDLDALAKQSEKTEVYEPIPPVYLFSTRKLS